MTKGTGEEDKKRETDGRKKYIKPALIVHGALMSSLGTNAWAT